MVAAMLLTLLPSTVEVCRGWYEVYLGLAWQHARAGCNEGKYIGVRHTSVWQALYYRRSCLLLHTLGANDR